MKTAFIIHGSNGNKTWHWYPWLKKKLEDRGFKVILEQFPTGDEHQTLNNWLATLEQFKEDINESIMIGHSLGVPFIIDVLNMRDYNIRAAFLVSGCTGYIEVEGESNLPDFMDKDYDWDRIKKHCDHFYVFHSDNDPYIPLEMAEDLAKNLGVEVNLIKGGEHFQGQSGYTEFHELLEKIDEEIK